MSKIKFSKLQITTFVAFTLVIIGLTTITVNQLQPTAPVIDESLLVSRHEKTFDDGRRYCITAVRTAYKLQYQNCGTEELILSAKYGMDSNTKTFSIGSNDSNILDLQANLAVRITAHTEADSSVKLRVGFGQ